MDTPSKTSRRTPLLAGVAAALIATSCTQNEPSTTQNESSTKTQSTQEKNNLYAILAKHTLRGQDGEIVNLEALKRANGEKYSTLSFSYVECGNGFCPLTNQKLATLGQNDNLVHYVVNLNPVSDGGFTPNTPKGKQDARDSFASYVRTMGVKGKIEILYPASTEDAKKIQNEAGVITNLNNQPQDHASMIILFSPNGRLEKPKEDPGKYIRNGVTDNISDWIEEIKKARGR